VTEGQFSRSRRRVQIYWWSRTIPATREISGAAAPLTLPLLRVFVQVHRKYNKYSLSTISRLFMLSKNIVEMPVSWRQRIRISQAGICSVACQSKWKVGCVINRSVADSERNLLSCVPLLSEIYPAAIQHRAIHY